MAKKPKTPNIESLSPVMAGIFREVSKSEAPTKRRTSMAYPDPEEDDGPKGPPSLVKSILNVLDGGPDNRNSIERLAFESDPGQSNQYSSLYKSKLRLIPDTILKRVSIQDDLVAAILQARSNHLGTFGRRRPDRFSMGFSVEPKAGVLDRCTEDQKKDIQDRIDKLSDKLVTCGETRGWGDNDRMTFAQFLGMATRDALTFGRVAIEVIYVQSLDGSSRPHSFRPIDAGTIYRAVPQTTAAQVVRESARTLIEQVKNKKLIPERFANDEYAWVQVIEGRPVQAFTPKECLVHNFYPVTNVELDGYPLTPIDTMISAVTTHVNITTHNKMYFQTGRATKGMLLIKSDDVDEAVVSRVRQQFNASINSVNNAWRMPVFAVGEKEDLQWQPMDQGARDAEFQYLADSNARVILSAYQMSPEELPGYAHLSRGTNSQALSECFHGDSVVWTDNGFFSAEALLADADEVPIRVWTGREFCSARLFRTGEKKLVETWAGGQGLKTSPDHRFRVLSDDGELVWRRQEELKLGDLLVVNRQPVAGDESRVPVFNGRKFTPALMEVLGWSVGDGTMAAPKDRAGGYLKFFYHPVKERDVWERHNQVLADFGFCVKHDERLVSEAEKEEIKARCGFKSVADSRITNVVYNSELVRFLADLGFSYSAQGKTVPPGFNTLPPEYRQAFLRGLFSADGHATETGALVLTVQDDRTREQVRQMLLGLGIRTLNCGGVARGPGSLGGDIEKQLYIKDKNTFWEQVGFLQTHKQARRRDPKWSLGSVPPRLAARLLGLVKSSDAFRTWTKAAKDGIQAAIAGTARISFSRLARAFSESGLSAPSWMTDYHVEPVVRLVDHDARVQMVDVEVFDDRHAQVLQGFQVHNSNNEYKLQAARDVGLKPLIKQWEDFVNASILPILDPTLAKLVDVQLLGLEAETAEKESIRIQQDMPVHMTYDEVMEKVEKDPIGKAWGGDIPINPQFQQILDNHTGLFVGEIAAHFLGRPELKTRPDLQYVRDPLWFQFQQLLDMRQQAQMQQAQMQQQQMAAQGQPQGQEGGPPPEEGGQPQEQPQEEGSPGGQQPPNADGGSDLTRSIDQAIGILTKSEAQLPVSKRRLLAQHKATVEHFIRGWENDVADATKAIMRVAKTKAPKKK